MRLAIELLLKLEMLLPISSAKIVTTLTKQVPALALRFAHVSKAYQVDMRMSFGGHWANVGRLPRG